MDENNCLKKLITSYVDYDTDYEAIEAGFLTNEMNFRGVSDCIGDHFDIIKIMEKYSYHKNGDTCLAKRGHFDQLKMGNNSDLFRYFTRWEKYKHLLPDDKDEKVRNALMLPQDTEDIIFIISTGRKEIIDDEITLRIKNIEFDLYWASYYSVSPFKAALVGGYKPVIDILKETRIGLEDDDTLFRWAVDRNDLSEYKRLLPYVSNDEKNYALDYGSFKIIEDLIDDSFIEEIGIHYIINVLIKRNIYKLVQKYDKLYRKVLYPEYNQFLSLSRRLNHAKIYTYFYNNTEFFDKIWHHIYYTSNSINYFLKDGVEDLFKKFDNIVCRLRQRLYYALNSID